MVNNQVQEPTLELYGIHGLWHIPFWQRSWFILFMLLLGFALVAFIGYILFKKYKTKKKPMPSWQQALNQLHDIKSNGLLSPTMSERYYVRLTNLLKEYISEQFGVDVRSFTDDQIVTYIDARVLYTDYKDHLKQIFTAGRLIKFANQGAIEKQMIDDWQHAHDFVMASRDYDNAKDTAI